MGRTSSKNAREREPVTILQPPSQKESAPSSPVKSAAANATVRPALSFANAAGGNKKNETDSAQAVLPSAKELIEEEKVAAEVPTDEVTASVEEMTV